MLGVIRNLLPEIPVMVLLTKDAGFHTGPDINGRVAAEPEASPESVITTWCRITAAAANRHCRYSSV
jgi:hypothetical protein